MFLLVSTSEKNYVEISPETGWKPPRSPRREAIMKEALIEKARVHEELRTMKVARGNQPGKRMGNYPPGN